MTTEVHELPEVGEIVVATIAKITDHGAYASLDEYNNIQGFLHASEIAHGWVRNINKFVKEAEPVIVRIGTKRNDGNRTIAICIDNKKNMMYLSDSSNMLDSINAGDVIECMPSQVFGNAITINHDSFVRKIDDDGGIPQLSSLRTKISEIKSGNNYCVEAIILKEPEKREVQTKTGETILLSEMFVEDVSGQIWIKGWRNQATLLDGLSGGEIISVTDVNAKAGLEGRTELFLTQFSAIVKKN